MQWLVVLRQYLKHRHRELSAPKILLYVKFVPVHPIRGRRKIAPPNLNISIINTEHSRQLHELTTLPTWKRPAVSTRQLTVRAPATCWTIFRWKFSYPCRQSNHGFSIIPPVAWTLQQPHNSVSLTPRFPATIYGSRTAMRRYGLK